MGRGVDVGVGLGDLVAMGVGVEVVFIVGVGVVAFGAEVGVFAGVGAEVGGAVFTAPQSCSPSVPLLLV